MKLYDSDKSTLIAYIENENIQLINPTNEVKKIDSYSENKFFAFGRYSELITFHRINSNRVSEHRWSQFEKGYYFDGVINAFTDNVEAAKFAVKSAL